MNEATRNGRQEAFTLLVIAILLGLAGLGTFAIGAYAFLSNPASPENFDTAFIFMGLGIATIFAGYLLSCAAEAQAKIWPKDDIM